jgi:hypothetical protein
MCILYFNYFTESPETIKMKVENERLTTEINRLKKLLENSPDGAVGGIEMSDNSFDAQSMDEGGNRIERLENELRIAKELITSRARYKILHTSNT